MPLLGELGATANYVMPVAPPGKVGGPDFPFGAYSPNDCTTGPINIFGNGKMPLVPPASMLPPGVRDISSWKITQTGSNSWKATALATSCGAPKQCFESLYDRDAKVWYCPVLGDPCGGAEEPSCEPVSADARYTWTDDYVQGRRKVPATADGEPIFEAARAPGFSDDPVGAITSGATPYLIGGAVLLLAGILLFRR